VVEQWFFNAVHRHDLQIAVAEHLVLKKLLHPILFKVIEKFPLRRTTTGVFDAQATYHYPLT
jgi:hypothetical protein